MTQVIYADVLFILNVYITYALLMLTSVIAGSETSRYRIAVAAVIGGFYSFIILIPDISDTAVTLSRIPAAILFTSISFAPRKARPFIRLLCCFFLVNFIFAGIMFSIWYFFSPQNMYMGGSVVYFDIKPLTLIMLTTVCYFLIKGINIIVKIRQPKNSIYRIKLHINDIDYEFPAFYDTGNNLSDPFTGKPVIIVSRSALDGLFPDGTDITSTAVAKDMKIRFLPCDSVGGKALLPCIKADRVEIKGISINIILQDIPVAITGETIKNGDFAALLPSDIFHNSTNEKGEDFNDANNKNFLYDKK